MAFESVSFLSGYHYLIIFRQGAKDCLHDWRPSKGMIVSDHVAWRNVAISVRSPGFCLRPSEPPTRRGSWQTHGRAVCRCLKQEVSQTWNPCGAYCCLTSIAKHLALTVMPSLTCQVVPDEEFNWAARYEEQLRALPLAAGATGIAGVLLNRLAGGVSQKSAAGAC